MNYVLGLGNVLMGDDGLGPAAVRAFEAEYAAGPDVEVVDLGTPGLDLTPWLFDAERVIIIDTVKSDGVPGTLRIYDKAAILRHPPSVRIGPHEPGIKEALLSLEFADRGPREVMLIGVVPQHVTMALDLSPPVRNAIPAVVDAIVAALRQFGETVSPRDARVAAPDWWRSPCGAAMSAQRSR